MRKYPTAKQKIENGEWAYLTFEKFMWRGGANYYIAFRKDGGLNLNRIETVSLLGLPFFKSMILLFILLKWLLNVLPLNGKVGDELLADGIEELREMCRARRHKESSGSSVQVGYNLKSFEECVKEVQRDVEDIKKNIERKRNKNG